jgi:hypothetical protein
VAHFGSTGARDYYDAARDHMARVNGTTVEEADRQIDAAFREWRGRSQLSWTMTVDADLVARCPELAALHRVGPLRAKCGEP